MASPPVARKPLSEPLGRIGDFRPPPAAAQGATPGRSMGGASSEDVPEYTVVKVFYATDRQKGDPSIPKRFYANERAPNRLLAFGTCEISIPGPDYHKVGRLEAPSIFTLDLRLTQANTSCCSACSPRILLLSSRN